VPEVTTRSRLAANTACDHCSPAYMYVIWTVRCNARE